MNSLTHRVEQIAMAPMAKRPPWRLLTACLVFLATLLLMPGAWGQDNATINGTVMDPTGAVIPNAAISLTNPATGQVRQDTSNSAGAYRFANLGVGTYTLSASVTGFQKYTKTDIVVNVAQSLEEDITLTIGSQGQTVTVAADALQVQSETSELSTLISGEQVSQLATNGRNVTSLAALGLGVSNNLPPFGGVNALTSSNGISFNGTRSTHNIYLLDGAEQNDRGCGGCFMNLPSQDALAEFQTLDSNYSPDYGIGSGGTIVMVLKSGTHSYHGEVYEFNRNTDYDAADYFSKSASEFKLNEPGGNIGGPLWIPHVYDDARNKTFFFWNEEWRRLIQGSSPSIQNAILASNFPTSNAPLTYTIPTGGPTPIVPNTANQNLFPSTWVVGQTIPANEDGTLTIPANLIDQNAVLEVNAGTFPKPNYNNGTQYIASIPQPTHVREDVVRIDHAINSKYQLMGHYLHDTLFQQYFPPLWGDSTYPTVGTTMNNPSFTAVIKLTQTYTPNLLNETAILYSGNKITLTPINGAGANFARPSGWTATSFFPTTDAATNDMPEIDLVGSPLNVNWSESYYPWKNGYEGFEYRDDLSYSTGRHQLKFGFALLHDYKNQQLQANTQGTAVFNSSNFSGDSYLNFMLGDASSFTQLQFLYDKHWVNNNYGIYANDNWHVSPRLTLNLGLRYDGLPHAFERYNAFANFVPADYLTALGNPVNLTDGTLATSQLTAFNGQNFYLNGIERAGVNGFPRGNVKNKYDTLQPRIGFAYNVSGNGKTVLRGGVGMFYERVQGNDVYNAALNPPFAYQPSATNVYFSSPTTNALTGAHTTQSFPSTMTNIKYNYPPPGTGNFSFGLQHELAPSIIAVVQYAGSIGWDQNDDRAINTLPLADPTNAAGPYATREAVSKGTATTNYYRNFPGYSTITQEENETNFDYNSFQAGVRLENRHGLTTQVAYTWGHNIDEVANDLNSLSNPYNPKYDRGSDTSFDRRHIFNVSYIYSLPFFAKSTNVAAKDILGGWQVSGVTVAEKGVPLYITYSGTDTLGLGGGTTNRPDQVSKVSYPKTKAAWFSTSSFAAPTAPWNGGSNQGFGSAGKDAVVGPGIFNWNLSLFKSIPLTAHEGPKIELRFESFNTFNHTIPQGVDQNTGDSNFGHITSDYGPRTLQLGGKIQF